MTASEQPRVRRLPRAVRERQILDAAVAVFSHRGYHAASMDEVSDVAGISKPMVYAYLGSKEELFATCIRREAERMMTALAEAIQPDINPDEQLWQGLRAFFEFIGGNRDSWLVLHRQASTQGGPFVQELTAMRGRTIQLIGALLARAAAEESLAEWQVEETDAVAAALVGAGESLADWWFDHPDETPKAMASRLMNVVWMGLGSVMTGNFWHPHSSIPPQAPAAN